MRSRRSRGEPSRKPSSLQTRSHGRGTPLVGRVAGESNIRTDASLVRGVRVGSFAAAFSRRSATEGRGASSAWMIPPIACTMSSRASVDEILAGC